MAKYIPRILLCGDEQEFRKIIGDKPVEVVGQINFAEKTFTAQEIRQLLDGTAEYLIFVNPMELITYFKNFPPNAQVMSANTFASKFHDGFSSNETVFFVKGLLDRKKFRRVLDLDCYLAKGDFRTRGDLSCKIDCVGDHLFPIMENIYDKTYATLDECRFHLFDAILITAERSLDEFIGTMTQTNDLADNILLFVRKNSELESWLRDSQSIFERFEILKTGNGAWCLIKKFAPPADVGVYIVTHKDAQLETLPDGYKIIHAGHALAKEKFGYQGDDTGDNISQLNPFLDEVTALYWIWKNTKHTHAGFVHYRRFFTPELLEPKRAFNRQSFAIQNILSAREIIQILSEYDIIVARELLKECSQLELMILSTKLPGLVALSEKVVRKHLIKNQPDYLDAYNAVINSTILFPYGVHVTRRNIFEAYCEWLFSFMIEATIEMRDTVTIESRKLNEVPHVYSRMMSFFAERMLTVWLMKNHLRIKTLPIMFRDDV